MSGRLLAVALFSAYLLAALLLAVYPMSQSASWFRPDLVVLLLIAWMIYRPHSLGVGSAWLIGLLQDVVIGGVWGAHALALAFVAYVCSKSYRRLRTYALFQQTFWVFVFVGIHHVFVNWVASFSGYSASAHLMFVSVLTSAICWPLLVLSLRKFGVAANHY